MALDLLNWGYVFLSNPEVFLVWNIIWISIKIFQGIFKTRYLWNETNNMLSELKQCTIIKGFEGWTKSF